MDLRHRFLTRLFELTSTRYAARKRCTPWNLSPEQLLAFPDGSLGQALGRFLTDRGFELMPRLESHDVCHLLTGVHTDVPGEIELQYLLFGNGKRSPYLLAVLLIGGALFPELRDDFAAASQRGASVQRFYDLDFRARLVEPLEKVTLDVADVDDDAVFVAPGGSLAKSQAGGISCLSDRSEIQRAGRLGP